MVSGLGMVSAAAGLCGVRGVTETGCACPVCSRSGVLIPFPSLRRRPRVAQARAVVEQGEASCFYHDTNQAAAVCDDCGRFLCPVCAVEFSGDTLCPRCIEERNTSGAALASSRVCYDTLALMVAALPLLMWFLTCLTAPAALGVIIYGWNKPGSLLRGRGWWSRRWRFLLAGVLATGEITGWIILLVSLVSG
ncbi:B-box zinc finger [Opitutaceae bacterium TAV1]|nr:B-box zinc finger [Opitutaceae bacterium TAV5]EIQ01710.1 B-box zinc finger [Opitutaceae bacterium TAV1]